MEKPSTRVLDGIPLQGHPILMRLIATSYSYSFARSQMVLETPAINYDPYD